MTVSLEHFLTYQHNVQRFFDEHLDKYEGIALPLSISVSFPTGTRGFVRALFTKDGTKTYFIDPRTALFQKEWDREKMRKPHIEAANIFGSAFSNIAVKRALSVKDFKDRAFLKSVVENAIKYQLSYPSAEDDRKKLAKYEKMVGKKLKELDTPQILVPPYFQYISQDDPWYEINLSCIETAIPLARANDLPLRPILHFRKWQEASSFDSTFKMLKKNNITSVWLYPNNFRELDALQEELHAYRTAVEMARSAGLKPYSLFGGYFSVLMGYFGLSGFGNGIGYGEWRDSGYHKGGAPMTRIYIPRLHRFLDAPTAAYLLDKGGEKLAEGSDFLSEVLASKEALEDVDQVRALDHFVISRSQEIQFVKERSLKSASAELAQTAEILSEIGPLESEKYGDSLKRWQAVIEA